MTFAAKYHPYQIALDRGLAAFDCRIIRGLIPYLRAVERKVLWRVK